MGRSVKFLGFVMFLLSTFLRLTRDLNAFRSAKSYCLAGWFLFFSGEADLAHSGPRVLSLYSDRELESILEVIIEGRVHVRLSAGQISQGVG